jgi:hypothetical protein
LSGVPAVKVTVAGLEVVGDTVAEGEEVALTLTMPAKPYRLVKVTGMLSVVPAVVTGVLPVVTAKSGVALPGQVT